MLLNNRLISSSMEAIRLTEIISNTAMTAMNITAPAGFFLRVSVSPSEGTDRLKQPQSVMKFGKPANDLT